MGLARLVVGGVVDGAGGWGGGCGGWVGRCG